MVNAKKELTTELQVLEAARKVFRAKGYAGARMQEIADEAKINKAMLHYYFRSKELLFQRIFFEAIQGFFGTVVHLLNDASSGWKEKIRHIAENYTEFLKANPEVPMFVMHELHQGGEALLQRIPIPRVLEQSLFMQQLREGQQKGEVVPVDPLQIVIMVISGLVFPFIAKPIIKVIGNLDEKNFTRFLDERKSLVPDMVIGYLEIKTA